MYRFIYSIIFIQLSLCRQHHLAKTLPQYTHCCNGPDRITPVNSLSIGLVCIKYSMKWPWKNYSSQKIVNPCNGLFCFQIIWSPWTFLAGILRITVFSIPLTKHTFFVFITILQFFAVKLKWLNQFEKLRHTTCEGKLKWGWVGKVDQVDLLKKG